MTKTIRKATYGRVTTRRLLSTKQATLDNVLVRDPNGLFGRAVMYQVIPPDEPMLMVIKSSFRTNGQGDEEADSDSHEAHNSQLDKDQHHSSVIRDSNRTLHLSERRRQDIRCTRPFPRLEQPGPLPVSGSWVEVQGAFANACYTSNTLGRDIILRSGDFMRVKHVIYSEQNDKLLLCGALFRSIEKQPISQMLSRGQHDTCPEVCQLLRLVYKHGRETSPQNLYTVPADQLLDHCRIAITNRDWVERLGAFDDQSSRPTLFCRYRYLAASSDSKFDRAREGTFMHITEAQADPQWRTSDDAKRWEWRGETQLGGSAQGLCASEIDLIHREQRMNQRAREQFPAKSSHFAYDIWSTEDNRQPEVDLQGTSAEVPISLDDTNGAATPSTSIYGLVGEVLLEEEEAANDADANSSAAAARHPFFFRSSRLSTTDHFWNHCLQRAQQDPTLHPSSQRYSIGDCFCGGGGTGRGMREAGLSITWAFDTMAEMCSSYTKLSPSTLVANTDAFGFINTPAYHHKVDILHLSPPCQVFSPAHTVVGQKDDENSAAQFMITGMLRAARPRVATLEQTEGIIARHERWFWALVEQFTREGWSVRWKVVNMAEYGVPQERMRLIVIASCPGEPLPSFPTPAHYKPQPQSQSQSQHHSRPLPPSSGLRPYHTVNDAIRGIPRTWADHNPSALLSQSRRNLRRFNGDRELAKTLTTHGGIGNNHPSGLRGYTMREFAALQTFPLYHCFPAGLGVTMVKRQIGNAVPPLFAKRLFEEVVRGLRRVDGLEEEEGKEGGIGIEEDLGGG